MGKFIQNYNLRYQMYILAGFCAISHVIIIGYVWTVGAEKTVSSIAVAVTIFEVLASFAIFGASH